MPPNPPSNSRLPRLAVWSGYGTVVSQMLLRMKIILRRRYNTAAPKSVIFFFLSGKQYFTQQYFWPVENSEFIFGRPCIKLYSHFLFSLLSFFLLFIAHHNLIKREFFRCRKETEGSKAEIHEMTWRQK